MKNQITKEFVYLNTAETKQTKITTLKKEHLLKQFTNVLNDTKTGKKYWFDIAKFMLKAQEYSFRAADILREIELSEYLEEDEAPCLRTIKRLLEYCQNPKDVGLSVGIMAIRRIGKAFYGQEDAFLEVIDEKSLCCMAEQYLAM